MKLKQREIVTVGIGAAIILIAGIVRLAPALSGSSSAESVPALLARIEAYNRLKQTVEVRSHR
jgi:hypothetical protein